MSKRKFAAFDIDGTIFRYALFQTLLEKLVADDIIPSSAFESFEKEMHAWKNRTHEESFYEFAMAQVRVFDEYITEILATEVEAAARSIVKESAGHVYVYTRDLIKELRKKDYFLVAISGSVSEIADLFAEEYGFDAIYSSLYERDGDRYTGEYTLRHNNKHVHLEDIIEKHDLTMEGSIAVGDSFGDVSMLQFVEQPIAFNPEKRLLIEAQKHGWKVVIERKNVVYELEHDNGSYRLG